MAKKKPTTPTSSLLWSPKTLKAFDYGRQSAAHLYAHLEDYLPYARRYRDLTPEELQVLIRDARDNHWTALDLSCCNLQELPDELWTLKDLQILALGNRSIKQSGSRNRISTIPRSIEGLTNLRCLILNNLNFLTCPGSDPLNLPNLHILDLRGPSFSHFPKALLLPSLSQLDLSHSWNLCELPERISDLQNLTVLNIAISKIKSLPASISKLTNLRHLDISNTPLAKKLPLELLYQDAQSIIRYVLQMQSSAPREYFNEAKLILVGQPQVGKSSLMKRLVHGTYTGQPSTEGIDIEPWHFSSENEEYRLNVWDFGGQEIYHATHQFFLTRRSIYLLVWDALSEDEYGRIDYWLRTIQSFADDSPILIVVNKCDRDNGRRKRLYLEDYQDRYPQVKNLYEVSCRDNIGIDELRRDVQSLAIGLDVMKTPWLSSWLNVRKKLEELAQCLNHISYGAYLDICAENDLTPEDALSLARYLHDLGVILYYHEDLLLRDLVILSSEWGTDAVYKILDEQERHLKGRNGILQPRTDLEQIWTDREKYPRAYYPHLLNLMENFQLTFPIENGDYLVAELLEGQAISLDLPFGFNETLRFRYDYDFMPAGVMTRFIVAANEYLEVRSGVRQCWKKGSYLRSGDAYALVQLFDAPPNRHIMIQVSGENPRSRQELLTVIRKKLDQVNSLFHKIQITRRIPCICRPGCPYIFNYESLLEAEIMGVSNVQCQKNWKYIDLRKLLDGVENNMEKDPNITYQNIFNPTIVNSPSFQQENKQSNDMDATTNVTISLEIRNAVNDVYDAFNDLRSEVDTPEFDAAAEKVEKALDKVDACKTETDIKRSGVMSKLKRFLEECHDSNTPTGKLLAGLEYSGKLLLNLGQKYNALAALLGSPTIPLIGT